MKFHLRQNRRPRNTAPHVSLFPFLAVLICTMGALVPLLLAISRQARLQAAQAAMAKDQKVIADVQAGHEMSQWRIEQLQVSRKKTETDIETARLELGHLEDHSRRLKAKIAELEKTIGDIERTDSDNGSQRAATSAELEDLHKQIEFAEKKVAEAKAKAAGKKRSFAIIPYEGPNSTHRRPIYIECRDDSVILQPEGIVLGVRDFEGPMGASNPLAMALRAEREYLLSKKGFDPQHDGEPYPLLLVRPDGVVAYYAARAAMKTWGQEFGYEFIESDWKLAYQPPDAQLARVVADAVESGRVMQERLIAAAPRQYSHRPPSSISGGSPGRGGGGNGSGLGTGSGTGRGSGTNGIAGGPSSGSGGTNGSGGSRGGYSEGFGGAGEGDGVDAGSWETDRPEPGAPDPFLAGVNNPYASLVVGGPGAGGHGNGGVPGNGGSENVGTGSGGIPGNGVPSVAGTGGATGSTGVMGPGMGASGNPGYPGTGTADSGPFLGNANGNDGTGAPGGTVGEPNGYGPQPAGQMTGTPGIPTGAQANNIGGQGKSGNNGNSRAGQGGDPKNTASTEQASDQEPGTVMGRMRRSTDPPDIFSSRVAANNAAKNAAERQGKTTSSNEGQGQGRVAPPLHAGEWYETPDPPPKEPESKADAKNKKKQKPPKYRGEEWGLKEYARGSVPLTRPVMLECQAKRLLILPEQGRGGSPMVAMASGSDSSVDDLVSAVWDRMSKWGMAGRGMYWRPVLHVRVAPGGEQRFTELQALLQGSGLDVVKR